MEGEGGKSREVLAAATAATAAVAAVEAINGSKACISPRKRAMSSRRAGKHSSIHCSAMAAASAREIKTGCVKRIGLSSRNSDDEFGLSSQNSDDEFLASAANFVSGSRKFGLK